MTFTPPNSWTFTGDDPARVRVRDDVTYHREPGNAPWRFTDVSITPASSQFSVDRLDHKVTIHDDHTANGTFCVVLTVSHDNGTDYPSPDPQIINEPSFAFPTIQVVVGVVVGAIAGALIDMNTGALVSRGPLKGAIVGAIIGALVGWVLARRRTP